MPRRETSSASSSGPGRRLHAADEVLHGPGRRRRGQSRKVHLAPPSPWMPYLPAVTRFLVGGALVGDFQVNGKTKAGPTGTVRSGGADVGPGAAAGVGDGSASTGGDGSGGSVGRLGLIAVQDLGARCIGRDGGRRSGRGHRHRTTVTEGGARSAASRQGPKLGRATPDGIDHQAVIAPIAQALHGAQGYRCRRSLGHGQRSAKSPRPHTYSHPRSTRECDPRRCERPNAVATSSSSLGTEGRTGGRGGSDPRSSRPGHRDRLAVGGATKVPEDLMLRCGHGSTILSRGAMPACSTLLAPKPSVSAWLPGP